MGVREEQRVEDWQSDLGRTSNTGAGLPCTAALIAPWISPATNSVINCPGATATGGYRYPIPTSVFTDALWPNAPEENAAHKIANVTKRRRNPWCRPPARRRPISACF